MTNHRTDFPHRYPGTEETPDGATVNDILKLILTVMMITITTLVTSILIAFDRIDKLDAEITNIKAAITDK